MQKALVCQASFVQVTCLKDQATECHEHTHSFFVEDLSTEGTGALLLPGRSSAAAPSAVDESDSEESGGASSAGQRVGTESFLGGSTPGGPSILGGWTTGEDEEEAGHGPFFGAQMLCFRTDRSRASAKRPSSRQTGSRHCAQPRSGPPALW